MASQYTVRVIATPECDELGDVIATRATLTAAIRLADRVAGHHAYGVAIVAATGEIDWGTGFGVDLGAA